MATLATTTGDYEVSAEEWQRVSKLRSSLLGLMRRTYQLRQKYEGVRYLRGDAHPATAERREQWQRNAAKVESKSAALRAVLERIERECPQVSAA